MTINSLILFSCICLIATLLWQHFSISRLACLAASIHCEKNGVVLLDQSVLLKGLRLRHSPHSLFALERLYHFEFSSIGDMRYQGEVKYLGKRLKHIQLEAYKSTTDNN